MTYLIGALLSLLIWACLFYARKDVRRKMLELSIIFAVFGIIMEGLIWTQDWWRPVTFTNTLVGFEDIIFGFSIGGIAGVIYEEVFGQKLSRRQKKDHPHTSQLILLISLTVILGSISYFYLDLNSAQSWIISVCMPILIIWLVRRDLIKDSILSGVALTVIAFIGFALMNLVEPGFVYKWWLFDHLSGIVLIGVPLEDIIWFFTLGMFVGPIYEFWQGLKLQKVRRRSK